jgi:PAS domain S-box-containing protein
VEQEANAGGRSLACGKAGPPAGYFRALLDGVSDIVTVSNRDGRIVYANPATERASGYMPEEFASLDPLDQMHPQVRQHRMETLAKLAATPGLSLELEHRLRHKDGSGRWVAGTLPVADIRLTLVSFSRTFSVPRNGLLGTEKVGRT